MADRPILFSAPMVRALLEGRKTQTRRVLKPQPVFDAADQCIGHAYAPKIENGDRLWVREAWRNALEYEDLKPSQLPGSAPLHFDLEVRQHGSREAGRYRHARYMPRWASRLTLLVTDVRVQRLQDISEDDARAEGIYRVDGHVMADGRDIADWSWQNEDCSYELNGSDAREGFERLWEFINGPDAWAKNPWVAAISFEVLRANIRQVKP